MARLPQKIEAKKAYKGVMISPEGIEVPWAEIAKVAKTTTRRVKEFAKDNPNTFVATLIAGPAGYLLGRKLDKTEKKKSK